MVILSTSGRPHIVVLDHKPTDADFDDPVDGLIVFVPVGQSPVVRAFFRIDGLWHPITLGPPIP